MSSILVRQLSVPTRTSTLKGQRSTLRAMLVDCEQWSRSSFWWTPRCLRRRGSKSAHPAPQTTHRRAVDNACSHAIQPLTHSSAPNSARFYPTLHAQYSTDNAGMLIIIIKCLMGFLVMFLYKGHAVAARWDVMKIKGKEECLYRAMHSLKALRHGSHSFTSKLHHACLSSVSIHQMASPLTEVADIQLQLTTHLLTPKG